MKKFTILAMFVALTLSASAQFYMNVWYNDSLFSLPVLNVDSVTFTDGPWVAPDTPDTPDTPDEPVFPTEPYQSIGIFTVGEGKAVSFSPGNLQYTQSTGVWTFARSQWEIVGAKNVTSTNELANKVDLFGWSSETSSTLFGIGTSEDYYDYFGSFRDWGTNQIGLDAPDTWRTLTKDEWDYLISKRTLAADLCGVAQVNGVNGLVLLPDTWSFPADVTFKAGFSNEWNEEAYATYQVISAEQWAVFEAAGAVFLPAAGSRSGANIYTVQGSGYYRTATDQYYEASITIFNSSESYIRDNAQLYLGASVRLVKDTTYTSRYVDLGLPSGTIWATCNVGANAPDERGGCYKWSAINPAPCGSVSEMNHPYYDPDLQYHYTKYNSTDSLTTLTSSDDAATANLGELWRMPTRDEALELQEHCTWVLDTLENGVMGCVVTGPNGNSIFLPGYEEFNAFNYWTSTCDILRPIDACAFSFSKDGIEIMDQLLRCAACGIRPVFEKPEVPEEPFVGFFSVSEDKQVIFSPGNLQYHPTNDEWRFAVKQTDYIGAANTNISTDYNGWIDLFGWGTGNNPTASSDNYADHSTFVDWGVNQIGQDPANTWRTLTYEEWDYLLNKRPNADQLVAAFFIWGTQVNGLVILPDNWVLPPNTSFKPGFAPTDEGYSYHEECGPEEWARFEAAGAIFLPAAGVRIESKEVIQVQYDGYYWTTTKDVIYPDHVYRLHFLSSLLTLQSGASYKGYSVRLVQDVQE